MTVVFDVVNLIVSVILSGVGIVIAIQQLKLDNRLEELEKSEFEETKNREINDEKKRNSANDLLSYKKSYKVQTDNLTKSINSVYYNSQIFQATQGNLKELYDSFNDALPSATTMANKCIHIKEQLMINSDGLPSVCNRFVFELYNKTEEVIKAYEDYKSLLNETTGRYVKYNGCTINDINDLLMDLQQFREACEAFTNLADAIRLIINEEENV